MITSQENSKFPLIFQIEIVGGGGKLSKEIRFSHLQGKRPSLSSHEFWELELTPEAFSVQEERGSQSALLNSMLPPAVLL